MHPPLADVDDFVVRLLPCGIVYVHREKFRSNVLVVRVRCMCFVAVGCRAPVIRPVACSNTVQLSRSPSSLWRRYGTFRATSQTLPLTSGSPPLNHHLLCASVPCAPLQAVPTQSIKSVTWPRLSLAPWSFPCVASFSTRPRGRTLVLLCVQLGCTRRTEHVRMCLAPLCVVCLGVCVRVSMCARVFPVFVDGCVGC